MDSDSRRYVVYMHVFPNGKRYVGITGRPVEKRWKRGRNYRNNIYFTRAVEKYGWDNIEHIIVESDLTKQAAEDKERMLIAYFGSNDPKKGYNITSGGECAGKLSIETRKKISEARKRQFDDPEFRKKMSECHKGITPPNKGIPMSEEQKKKVSLAKMGCEGHGKRKILCVETGIVYESLTQASKETGANMGKLVDVCKGHRKTTKGFHWEYVGGEP